MLSIIVPVYNAEKFLYRCIESILAQTYTDFELLLVNDGSIDCSLEICEQYIKQDKRVKIFTQKNCGVSVARNTGIENATGEFVTFVDADDWIEPQMYEKMMKRFSEEMSVDIVIGGFVRQKSDRIIPVLKKKEETIYATKDALQELLVGKIFRGELCDKIYRKNLLDDIRLDPSITVAEDLLFNWLVFQKARRILYYPIWAYHYEINQESATNKFSEKNLTYITAVEKMMQSTYEDDVIMRTLYGVYGRCLASTFFRMVLTDMGHFRTGCTQLQEVVRSNYLKFIVSPKLSLRQRLGITYAALPLWVCSILANIAKLGQRNV